MEKAGTFPGRRATKKALLNPIAWYAWGRSFFLGLNHHNFEYRFLQQR
jgi:hypothetical protein